MFVAEQHHLEEGITQRIKNEKETLLLSLSLTFAKPFVVVLLLLVDSSTILSIYIYSTLIRKECSLTIDSSSVRVEKKRKIKHVSFTVLQKLSW